MGDFMFKRFLSIILAVCVFSSCLCISSFASTSDVSDVKNACGQYFSLLDDYLRGDITYESFKDKTTALLHDVPEKGKDTFTKLVNGLTNAAEGISYGVSNGTAAFVQGFRDFADGMADFYNEFYDGVIDPISNIFDSLWDKFCNDNGYVTSDFDMQGYGACFLMYNKDGSYDNRYYCDYVEIVTNGTSVSKIIFHGDCLVLFPNGSSDYYTDLTFVSGTRVFAIILRGSCDGYTGVLCGDVRYSDGSLADDYITENNNTPLSPDDIDPNTDLTDFLEALLDKLKNMFPDLSTVEGLLRAILAQCQSINGKLDSGEGNIDYSELSQLLDSSIVSIVTNNNENQKALLDELIKIREAVTGIEDGEEPDEGFFDKVIDFLANALGSALGVFLGNHIGDGSEDDVSGIVDICIEAGSTGTKFLSTLVDLIVFLNKALPLYAIQSIMGSLQDMIFSTIQPSDLSFSLFDTNVTLLSVSFINNDKVVFSINIIKGFLSIILLWNWLKWFRRFCVSRF